MPVSRLAIYTAAHGIDPVTDHLDKLETMDYSPEFVALEYPDIDDSKDRINSLPRKLIRQSPATGLAWYFIERINKRAYKTTDGTADRGDSEFKAGRQYADQHGIPAVSVDLTRSEIADQYTTWPRRIRDTAVLIAGVGTTVAIWGFAVLLALGAILSINDSGLTIQSILSVAIVIGIAVFLTHVGRFPAIYAVGKIGYWFRDTMREFRNRAMYERIKQQSTEQPAAGGLLIVGAAHFTGIKALAEQDGVDCWQVESPAISRYKGDSEDISPQEMSELTKNQAEA